MKNYEVTTGIFKGHQFDGTPTVINHQEVIWDNDSVGRSYPKANCKKIEMKQNLQERLLRMKRLAGLITENEYDNEFEVLGKTNGNEIVQKKVAGKKEVAFDSSSDSNVEFLFNKLKREGVNLEVYPQWLFSALVDEGYAVKDDGTGKYGFTQEGLQMFRDPSKLKQYLVTADESEGSLDEVSLKEEDSDASYYSGQLSNVKVGATEFAPTIKVFANGNGQDTKHMSLNKTSATVLVEWLTANFINASPSNPDVNAQ